MNVFETIKAAVPMREAAEHYGLQVLPNGMASAAHSTRIITQA